MSVLFCNIAWMRHYAGRTKKDPPLGGGGFPVAEGYCGEECNFVPCEDGFVYGHFETIKGEIDRQVRIERLGASRSDEYIDGLDVVWTAPTRGHDPRTVVGWWRNARLYRNRQQFGDDFPSDQHERDDITSFRVRAHRDDVFLLEPNDRTLDLGRGAGWSGQTSWWYADDTTNKHAARFVAAVKAMIAGDLVPPVTTRERNCRAGRKKRAGAATDNAYERYTKAYEITVHPRHDKLQKKFAAHVTANHPGAIFPICGLDDLRYIVGGKPAVMVEVKPTDPGCLRYAIRAAIGQLLDYRQREGWTGPQLIVVEDKVHRADDLGLAFDNGFGLAWPEGKGFEIVWPDGTMGC